MEVSLRKADQLANAVKELLTDNSMSTAITLNAFDVNWKVKMTAAREEVEKKVERLDRLYTTLCEIRKVVGRANAESGINDLLANDNLCKQKIAIRGSIMDAEAAGDDETIGSNLEARKTPGEQGRFGWDRTFDMAVNLLDKRYLGYAKAEVAALKRTRRNISDELISKNVTVKVKLSEYVVENLKAENLI
jgi:hypothetical protein